MSFNIIKNTLETQENGVLIIENVYIVLNNEIHWKLQRRLEKP